MQLKVPRVIMMSCNYSNWAVRSSTTNAVWWREPEYCPFSMIQWACMRLRPSGSNCPVGQSDITAVPPP